MRKKKCSAADEEKPAKRLRFRRNKLPMRVQSALAQTFVMQHERNLDRTKRE